MNSNDEKDPFYKAIHDYEKGNIVKVFHDLIYNPDICYDTISSEVPTFRYLLNYLDASVYGGRLEVQVTRKILFDEIEKNAYLKIVLNDFIEVLEDENILGNAFVEEPVFVDIKKVPSHLQPMIQKKLKVLERWNLLNDRKPAMAKIFSGIEIIKNMPWHCFTYPSQINPSIEESGEIPLVFLEPFDDTDYGKILTPYIGKEAIYVCATYADFFHMLQWDAVMEAFSSPFSILYILEAYPQEQFSLQISNISCCRPLKLVLITSRTAIIDAAPLIKNVLEKYLFETKGDFLKENSTANWLYSIAKRLLFRIKAERLGRDRSFALHIYNGIQEWHDPHKGLPTKNADLGPLSHDYLAEIYAEASKCRKKKSHTKNKKIRIAHVVAQVVDGGHAPTILIKNLLQHSDKEKYERFLISTERLMHYPLEYPIPLRDSLSSTIRGANTLDMLRNSGVNIIINTQFEHYETTARYLAGMVNLLGFDIVIFHGPDETNNLIGSLSESPLRVLFDHGTLPSYPCYDLAIVSSEDSLQLHGDRLKALGIDSRMLMFCVDVRKGWEPRAFTKVELGFPSDSIIMTTISNHLEARLSNDLCHAIGEILQRCPNAYYAPIGPVKSEDRVREVFSTYGVNDRVVFMGNRRHPSQFARSMDLYLNEYPFGSGIGILDAMAAGCPIVSMYDEQGPQQSRYGGTYFGVDHVVTTGKRSDYVNLACRLIQDTALYQEWSAHALAQYERRVDEKKYIKNFEAILEKTAFLHETEKPLKS